jgi:hypothetical protein
MGIIWLHSYHFCKSPTMSPYFVLDKVMEPIEGQLLGDVAFTHMYLINLTMAILQQSVSFW